MHRWIGALALLAVAGISLPAAAANETITIVADEWCPYNCGENDAKPGYMVEIARAAFRESDIDVVYKVMPWSEAISMTRQGAYAAVFGANRGDAPDFIFPELIQGISVYQAWIKPDLNWKYTGVASLDGLRMGIVDGYFYGKAIDSYLKKKQSEGSPLIRSVKANNATEYNIGELLTGNIDVLMEDKNVITYYFSSHGQPLLLKSVGNPVDLENIDDTYLFIAFSPAHPRSKDYAEMLARGMKKMRQNGELLRILSSYNVDGLYRFVGTSSASNH